MRKQSLPGLIAVAIIVLASLLLMCGAGVLIRDDASDEASGDPGLQVTGSEEIAESDPVLYVNDKCIDACMLISGEPYVDIAAFCGAFGLAGSVSGDGTYAAVNDSGVMIMAEVGNRYIMCNDRYFYLAGGICQINGAPAASIDILADVLGVSASWDRDTNIIEVIGDSVQPVLEGSRVYDENDVYWLSRFVYAQAGDGSMDEKIAMADVILNRAVSSAYEENNIYDVIFAKNQFDVVVNGMIYMEPDEDSVIAAKIALEGADLVGGATEFVSGSEESSLEFVIQIDEYRFYEAA